MDMALNVLYFIAGATSTWGLKMAVTDYLEMKFRILYSMREYFIEVMNSGRKIKVHEANKYSELYGLTRVEIKTIKKWFNLGYDKRRREFFSLRFDGRTGRLFC